MTRKSGHILRILAEMTQPLIPKSGNQSSPNSLARVQFRQNSPNLPEFHQISPTGMFAKLSPNVGQIAHVLIFSSSSRCHDDTL